MSALGQTITTAGEYFAHPPAASTEWADGDSLDAGTAHILDSNISHLAAESCRHLVVDVLPLIAKLNDHGYDALDDVSEPPAGAYAAGSLNYISWDRETGRCYGPFFGIADRVLTDVPGYGLRTVRVMVDTNAASNASLTIFLALTATRDPPTDDGALTFVSFNPASGRQQTPKDLDADTPPALGGRSARRCRPTASATTGQYVYPAEYWLWVGWYATDAADHVVAVSAYESRE
jgi:hypothetical protein